MGLFNKLANILFDEEEVDEEIPTITKSEEKVKKKEQAKTLSNDDEIIVTKVETKKEAKEETFEAKKQTEENDIRTKKFTFPFMDDDDELLEDMLKRAVAKTKEDYSYANTIISEPVKEATSKKHDFLSKSKTQTKSDAYTANRNNIYDPTNTEHRPFTLSPIISPVYGILNENYTKDDIIEKISSEDRNKKIVFDSVRRKAYGTLEDEIEVSLTRKDDEDDYGEENQKEMTVENLKEDGISISDLLIGDEDDEKTEELFDIEDISELTEQEDNEETSLEIEDEEDKKVVEDVTHEDKTDDLFDLIDSIYAGKDKE